MHFVTYNFLHDYVLFARGAIHFKYYIIIILFMYTVSTYHFSYLQRVYARRTDAGQ